MDRELYYSMQHQRRFFWDAANREMDAGNEESAMDFKEFAEEIDRTFPFNILTRPNPIERSLKQRVEDYFGIPY